MIMMKNILILAVLLITCQVVKSQSLGEIAYKSFVNMTYDEVFDEISLHIPAAYMNPNNSNRTYSIRMYGQLMFIASFDENWKCFEQYVRFSEEYETVYTARTMHAGFKYSEDLGFYVSPDGKIITDRRDINFEPFWFTGRKDYKGESPIGKD